MTDQALGTEDRHERRETVQPRCPRKLRVASGEGRHVRCGIQQHLQEYETPIPPGGRSPRPAYQHKQ